MRSCFSAKSAGMPSSRHRSRSMPTGFTVVFTRTHAPPRLKASMNSSPGSPTVFRDAPEMWTERTGRRRSAPWILARARRRRIASRSEGVPPSARRACSSVSSTPHQLLVQRGERDLALRGERLHLDTDVDGVRMRGGRNALRVGLLLVEPQVEDAVLVEALRELATPRRHVLGGGHAVPEGCLLGLALEPQDEEADRVPVESLGTLGLDL